ncbi:MAG: mannosyltransferase B-like protein [Parcubacteria group bacterium GW2011_GWA2_44_12]|nr:MAG: mannosyltransferase B-like protein [Parcubacteria group bacterium GW2011_GWA2_44_12]
MKIGIDARLYGPKHRGIGRYIFKLIENLEQLDWGNQYTIFLEQENFDDYSPSNENFTKALLPYRWYSIKEQIFLARELRKHNLDFVHFPNFNVPFFFRHPFIVTIHDLVLDHFPGERATQLPKPFYYLKLLAYRDVIRHAIKHAKTVITPSEFTSRDILSKYKISASRIRRVYLGAPYAKKDFVKVPEYVQTRFGINRDYLLYVGAAYPHKNLETLISAFSILLENTKKDYQLVLASKKDFFYSRLEKEIKENYPKHISHRIIFTDYVLEKDMPQLYANARLYIFPSFYEGFGLPPLEAMAHGVPVIASDVPCLKEILGDAAVYFSPEDQKQLAQTMSVLLPDHERLEEMKQKGFTKVEEYSWEDFAKNTLQVYNDVEAMLV